MRQIKFRAWDTQDNRYIADFTNYAAWEAKGKGENAWRDDRYIKEQFTGRCDKNKKDSYDGDKIRTANWGDVVIEWNDNASCFGFYYYSLRNKSLKCWVPLYKVVEFEVIGNIREEQK